MRALVAVAITSCLTMTGCKSEAEDLTDAQLITALSGSADASAIIPRPVSDCIAFFVGANSGEFRNAQDAERPMIDAMCVTELESRLRRQEAGSSLDADDFRKKEMAERVLKLVEVQDAAAATQKAKSAASKREAMSDELGANGAEIAKVRDAFMTGIGRVRAACEAFDAAFNEMLAVDRANDIIAAGSPDECGYGVAFEDVERSISEKYDALMAYKVPDNPGPFDSVPGIGIKGLPDFEVARQAVQLRVDEMKAAIEAAH